MRISDWSSDVCSSDLLGCLRIVSETHLQKIEIADDWRQKIVEIVSNSSRHLADHFDLFHLMDLTLGFFQLLLSEQIVGHIAPDGKDARIILVRILWYNGPADMPKRTDLRRQWRDTNQHGTTAHKFIADLLPKAGLPNPKKPAQKKI